MRSSAGSYGVVIEAGLAKQLAARLPAGRRFVIADSNTASLVPGLGEPFVVSAGEASKGFATLEQACREAARQGHGRDSLVVAVGGGVVGDLAGVVAASYMRGVRLVHVPTSLLAMVDSAIGGKAAIDIPEGKNLVGAFKPPEAVFIDPGLLRTLPEREFRSGLAEVAKYSMIWDEHLFASLLNQAGRVLQRDEELLTTIIERCCAIKAEVVSRDEREQSLRAVLNYGHTVGHALEAATGYASLTHGEAISLGMGAAVRVGVEVGVTPADTVASQDRLLDALELPRALPVPVEPERVLTHMTRDKKKREGQVRWVLLEKLGRASAGHEVPNDVVERAIRAL